MDFNSKCERKTNPKEKANVFSTLSFFYTLKIFKLGLKNELTEESLYEVPKSIKSKTVGDYLECFWIKLKSYQRVTALRLILRCYGWPYLLLGIIQIIGDVSFITIKPYALGKFIAYFDVNQNELTKLDAYMYAFLLIGYSLASCIFENNFSIVKSRFSLKIRTALSSLIYRKILTSKDISVGNAVTLLTRDVPYLEDFIHFANDLWISVLNLSIASYMIYRRIGVATLLGNGFLLIVLPIQILLGVFSANSRLKMCKETDNRLETTKETLMAIRIVKYYSWENAFIEKINETRKKEIAFLHKIFYCRFTINLIADLTSKISFYIILMSYIWLGNNVTAENIYFLLACFQMISYLISGLLPNAIARSANMMASIKRIDLLLSSDNVHQRTRLASSKPQILCKNLSIPPILNNINLKLDSNLTVMRGTVGKSTLIRAVLDEVVWTGHLEVSGTVSYAAQEPWVFPSTIRQNIIFGERFQEKRYHEVLNACALVYDLNQFINGDQELVEDGGANLSRGQRIRINLARAVYRNCDIYLLDDSLSGLNAEVCQIIMHKLIGKLLKKKVVVLVTHGRVRFNENVVVLKDGTVEINPARKSYKKHQNQIIEEELESKELIEGDNATGNLYKEVQNSGKIGSNLYKKIIDLGGGGFVMFLIIIVFAISQFNDSYIDKLLSEWVNLEQKIVNVTSNETILELNQERNRILLLYSTIILSSVVLNVIKTISMFIFFKKVSVRLHKQMVSTVFRATISFFDNTYIGNILNRFSRDLTYVDESIPLIIRYFIIIILEIIANTTLIATVNPIFLIPTAMILIILLILRAGYIATGRNLKRLEASSRSPVLGHLNATAEGLPTIRACQAQNIMKDEFDRHQDLLTSTSYIIICTNRAFAFTLEICCLAFVSTIILTFLFKDDKEMSGNVGLAVSQGLFMTASLQWGIRMWTELENSMTSLERTAEYVCLETENTQGQQIDNWPTKGGVSFQNVSLELNGRRLLNQVSFNIEGVERVGVVGRTGSGKSLLMSQLLRLYKGTGRILIDGIDIRTLSIEFLRKNIAIVPQDPIMFSGNVRNNIDPLSKLSDSQLESILMEAGIGQIIPGLDCEVNYLSSVERQLICLARALVQKTKIIILDEITASLDSEADDLFEEIIRKSTKNCTVFIVAHKLEPILSLDKVIVMFDGNMVEFGNPKKLIDSKSGHFYSMVKDDLLFC